MRVFQLALRIAKIFVLILSNIALISIKVVLISFKNPFLCLKKFPAKIEWFRLKFSRLLWTQHSIDITITLNRLIKIDMWFVLFDAWIYVSFLSEVLLWRRRSHSVIWSIYFSFQLFNENLLVLQNLVSFFEFLSILVRR